MTTTVPRRSRLLVLVSAECNECRRATRIAAAFGELAPQVDVRVVDVTREPVPDGVILVGTPMYIDDTTEPTVLSLGNPAPAQLARHYGTDR